MLINRARKLVGGVANNLLYGEAFGINLMSVTRSNEVSVHSVVEGSECTEVYGETIGT